MKEFEVILEPAVEGGYTVICPILKGCISEGDSKNEAMSNIKDAILLYLRAVKKEEKVLFNKRKDAEVMKVAVDA